MSILLIAEEDERIAEEAERFEKERIQLQTVYGKEQGKFEVLESKFVDLEKNF